MALLHTAYKTTDRKPVVQPPKRRCHVPPACSGRSPKAMTERHVKHPKQSSFSPICFARKLDVIPIQAEANPVHPHPFSSHSFAACGIPFGQNLSIAVGSVFTCSFLRGASLSLLSTSIIRICHRRPCLSLSPPPSRRLYSVLLSRCSLLGRRRCCCRCFWRRRCTQRRC